MLRTTFTTTLATTRTTTRTTTLATTFAAALFAAGTALAAAQDVAPENRMTIELDSGDVVIALRPDLAPQHVERIKTLAADGAYDGVVFHRVIDGFMAQTGDVEFGREPGDQRAGTGGSSLPDLPAEFTTSESFERGMIGMARSSDPNSANSQFFIMLDDAPHLNGQYTIVGEVIEGMENVDEIKKGDSARNGLVMQPDRMIDVTVGAS